MQTTKGTFMTYFRFPRGVAVVAVAMTFASPMALAQTADVEPPSRAASQVTDQQLETYAVAALEVQKINQTYQPKISQAESPEEQKILYDKATQEMTQAIRENGMSIEQYNQLTTVVQSNPDLSTKLQSYIEKKQ